ncbi:MAG: hypothetical protein LBD11_07585 [Candidatus Peribacteria bacterium]|jgi:hypothetical protein|nr:hypothetical protein [Candidatus Peribacteria bacterium]
MTGVLMTGVLFVCVGIFFFFLSLPYQLILKEEKKEKKLSESEKEFKRLSEKVLGKELLYLISRSLLTDDEGYILEEWLTQETTFKVETTCYCPTYLPVKVVEVRGHGSQCDAILELDQEKTFIFEVKEIGTDKVKIVHPLLGECMTNKVESCKKLKDGSKIKIRFCIHSGRWEWKDVSNRIVVEDEKDEDSLSEMSM